MGFSEENLKGLVLALMSSGFIGGSFIIKKKGLKRAAAASGVRAGVGGYSYLLEPLWWFGMIIMIFGEVANFVAYAFAPAVLVTPLGALSIIVSAVLAHFILNERLHSLGVLGCIMCIAGSVIIVIHAPQERPITSVQEIWSLATQTAFLLYVGSVLVLVFILVFYFAPLCGHSNVLVFTCICYLMGSLSMKASELRKKNRASKKGILHASGNKTFEERKLTLWKSLGRPPTQWELFNETHLTKRGGSTEKKFITEDAEIFSETYANKLREANGLEPTDPVKGVDDPGLKLYEEAVGGVKKGRLPGRPNEKWSKKSGHVSSSDFVTQVALQQSSQEVKKLKEQLAESERKRLRSERKRRRYEANQNANYQMLYEYMVCQAAKHGDPPPPRPLNFNANSGSEGASNTRNDSSPTNHGDDEIGDYYETPDDEMGTDDNETSDDEMGEDEMGEH